MSQLYAAVHFSVKLHGVHWGTAKQGGTRKLMADAGWRNPLKWNRAAEKAGERHRVFCASLADVFEEWRGPVLAHKDEVTSFTLNDLRSRLFDLIDSTPWLDWLLLTKRPENVLRMWSGPKRDNVWLGTSVSDQQTADIAIPELRKCRDLASVLFLSAEPLVGPININFDQIDWAISGGESGPHARPCEVEWLRSIKKQCRAARVPLFVKQLGTHADLEDPKGGDPAEWPRDLRVRKFPVTTLTV